MLTVIKRVSRFEQQMGCLDGTVYVPAQSLGLLHDVYRNAHHYISRGVHLYDDGCLANGACMRMDLMETDGFKHIP